MKLFMLRNIFTREQTVPKYKYMEVESELETSKDLLIKQLEDHIHLQNQYIAILVKQTNDQAVQEVPKSEEQPIRRKISTVSELATILEASSLERKRKNDEKNNPKHSS